MRGEQEAGVHNKTGLTLSRLQAFIGAVPSSPAWQTADHDDGSSRLESEYLSSGSNSGTHSMCTFDSGQFPYLYNVWWW